MEMSLQVGLHQTLRLAPQIIQSIEILQLPVQELKELVSKELEENPTLEEETQKDETLSLEAPTKEETSDEPLGDRDDYELVNRLESDLQEYGTYEYKPSKSGMSGERDGKLEAMKNTAAKPVSLQEYLYQQFHMLDPSPLMREIGEAIIFNIDDAGYLQYTLEEIAESIDIPVVLEDVEKALSIIQSIDPPGVGARNLKECLLLQLNDKPQYAFQRHLVLEHLEDIVENRIPKIAKETGKEIEQINEALEIVRTLNPRPGSLFGGSEAGYIVPDVIVDYIDGEYAVTLENGYIPQLQVNPAYQRMLQESKNAPDVQEYIKKKLESAKWLISSIEQRRSTVYRIAERIVQIQREFLDKGVQHLKPLKMQSVAEDIGVHVSTVSRAIANKYIQTRRGIFEMKYFFTGGTVTGDGTVESRTSVRQRVIDVIDTEDKARPLSDEEIAERLRGQGLEVARRTVTKYRKAMRIPSSRQRKVYT